MAQPSHTPAADQATTDQSWSDRFRALAGQPFALLGLIETALGGRTDRAEGQAATWSGLSVQMGDQNYVLPRREVTEVMPMMRLSRVPGARSWLAGVGNVRGNLLPVIDLAEFYGLSGPAASSDGSVVTVRSDGQQVGFRVSAVHGYREFGVDDQRNSMVDDAPEAMRPDLLGGFVSGGQRWHALSLVHLMHSDRFLSANAGTGT